MSKSYFFGPRFEGVIKDLRVDIEREIFTGPSPPAYTQTKPDQSTEVTLEALVEAVRAVRRGRECIYTSDRETAERLFRELEAHRMPEPDDAMVTLFGIPIRYDDTLPPGTFRIGNRYYILPE